MSSIGLFFAVRSYHRQVKAQILFQISDRYQNLMNSSPMLILDVRDETLHAEHRRTLIRPRVLREWHTLKGEFDTFPEFIHYAVDELVGHTVLKVFYEPDREEAQAHAAQCLKQLGRSFSWELRVIRKSGSVLWVRETARAVFRDNGPVVLIACEDVTERKQAEQELQEQEMELRQILDLTPQHLAVIGPGGEHIFANRTLLDYFGLRLEDWQCCATQTLFHPDDWERVVRGAQEANQYEARLRRYDGEYHWFLVRDNPLHDEQGQITRWYVAGTDIEDRRQTEERLRRRYASCVAPRLARTGV